MNTVTKMLLIPEDRFRDPANLILTSNLPSDKKVRLVNQIKMKELDRQKENQNFQSIMDSKATPLQKKKLLENFFGEPKLTVETGVQPDYFENMDESSEFETPPSSSTILNSTILDSTLLDTQPTINQSTPEPVKLPPLQPSPKMKSLRLSAIGASGISPKSKAKVHEGLKYGLKSIIGLVSKDEGIVNEIGHKLRYSNLDSIVKYLTSNDTGRKPIGTDVVIDAIRNKKPYLKTFITNPVVLGDKSWGVLQKSYDKPT